MNNEAHLDILLYPVILNSHTKNIWAIKTVELWYIWWYPDFCKDPINVYQLSKKIKIQHDAFIESDQLHQFLHQYFYHGWFPNWKLTK